MALLHSRVERVFYLRRMSGTGGLRVLCYKAQGGLSGSLVSRNGEGEGGIGGTGVGKDGDGDGGRLNWKFEVWEEEGAEEEGDGVGADVDA
jgi:hypothetical protein